MITYNHVLQLDEMLYRLSGTSDVGPPSPIRIYREGVLVTAFSSPTGYWQIDFTASFGDFPFFEVLDKHYDVPANPPERDSIPTIAFPGHLTLHWSSTTGSSYYRIEKFPFGPTDLLATVTDNGAGAFTWLTDWLADETLHEFRIIPVDAAGNLGTPQPFSATMVRHPDTPNVAYVYNGAGTPTVTISAA